MCQTLRLVKLFCLIALITSCGGGGGSAAKTSPSPDPDSTEDPVGLLALIQSDAELLTAIRSGFETLTSDNSARMASESQPADAAASDSASTSFTTTYNLEANVDEHDAVKYDGNHLFIAPSRSMDCCFIIDDIASASDDNTAPDISPVASSQDRSIRILSTDPENGTATEVSTIALNDAKTIEGLYTHNTQLAAISSTSWWGSYGDAFTRASQWRAQTTGLSIYDISDATAPSTQLEIEFEGGFVNSRKVGNTIYLIARHTPEVQGLIDYPTAEQQQTNQVLLDNLTVNDIMPALSINGQEAALVDSDDCLLENNDHKLASANSGYPTLTLLIAVDLTNLSIANTACYIAPTNGIYISENAIYLTQIDYSEAQSRTLIHRFALSQTLTYQGSGAVDGSLYLSGDRDFRISEYDGFLRLVTTDRTDNAADQLDHKLWVLQRNTQDKELNIVGSLPNNERPAAIGKPNEDLYGVRFFGNKLYLVTFERIDPLYAIDLTDPTDPKIAGELMIPGFSDFLHPVNQDLLLGLGEDENGLVKLELFNVADMTGPYSLGTTVLGQDENPHWSYSEARYNRHAFTYQIVSETQDRFTVPVTLATKSETSEYQEQDRLYLFEINGKEDSALGSIDEIGHISVARDQWQNSRNRAVIHGDTVYYINNTSVWSTDWMNPSEQNGPM
jgi:uncharacterized secreted protein with C-terminal beta-propeller domain